MRDAPSLISPLVECLSPFHKVQGIRANMSVEYNNRIERNGYWKNVGTTGFYIPSTRDTKGAGCIFFRDRHCLHPQKAASVSYWALCFLSCYSGDAILHRLQSYNDTSIITCNTDEMVSSCEWQAEPAETPRHLLKHATSSDALTPCSRYTLFNGSIQSGEHA
jgi:hypothetical protein